MDVELHFLGTGAAEGIPAAGCNCRHCRIARERGGRYLRRRSAILVTVDGFRLLVDAPPDLFEILNHYNIFELDAVYITHSHYDHVGGLREFEHWPRPLELFLGADVEVEFTDKLVRIFDVVRFLPYAQLDFDTFTLTPLKVDHTVPTYGLVVRTDGHKIVITSDTSAKLSSYQLHIMRGADILVANTPALEEGALSSHLSVTEALRLARRLDVGVLVLTHINHHNLPYDELVEFVRERSEDFRCVVAYDGLRVRLGEGVEVLDERPSLKAKLP